MATGSGQVGLELDDAAIAEVRSVVEVYYGHANEIEEALRAELLEDPELARVAALTASSDADREREKERRLLEGALEGDWQPYLSWLAGRGRRYASAGLEFRQWFPIITAFRRQMVPLLAEVAGEEEGELAAAMRGLLTWTELSLMVIGEAYLEEHVRVIEVQQDAIRELSTPVLELEDGLLLLPLVGPIDSSRAAEMTQSLLETIAARRARVVVVDVTGVPEVDTAVASHLAQTVVAAGLMGARSVVTGISAANAQTMVRLDVDLGGVPTLGSLSRGIATAHELLDSPGRTVA